MDSLNKIKHISYNTNSGVVNYEEGSLVFNEGDKQVAFIHLRGNLPNYIKAQMKIKSFGEIILVTGKVITNNKNVCREFPLVIDKAGTYSCQLVLSYKDQINNSNVFKYEVLKGIEGGNLDV